MSEFGLAMLRVSCIFAVTLVTCSTQLRAGIIFQHNGSADPTTEGWTFVSGSGTAPAVGAVTNDLGTGLDAWFVDDNGTMLGDGGFYNATPSAAHVAEGNAFGWTLSTRLRVVDVPDTPGGSPVVVYRDGNTSWQMHFGSEADGDPIVNLFTNPGGPSHTLQGAGGGYHLYELIYDPVAASADLFVDGAEVISDFGGFAFSGTLVDWGGGSSADVGQGNFNFVHFETGVTAVPEPSSIALLGMGGLGLIGRHYRRRKRKQAA